MKKLKYLRENYGEPYFFCNGQNRKDLFWELLNTDSQKIKNKIIMGILQSFSDYGFVDKNANIKSFVNEAKANTIFLECGVKDI